MLTVNNTMELKSLSPICNLSDPLSERIRGEYDIIRADFTPEDLLHLVTEPAEVFFEGGTITNLFTDNRVQNTQNIKIDMVNNLMNRLVTINRQDLTYRDTVYIEAALHKLGITNVNKFMNEVNRMKVEEYRTEKLISLYGDNLTQIKNVVNEALKQETKTVEPKEERSETPSYYLHNSIYNRLDTANIYREMSLIYSQLPGREESVAPREIEINEQLKASENIILDSLTNYVREGDNVVNNRTYNLYVDGERSVNYTKEGDVIENLVSAVLLNLSDKAFLTYLKNYSEAKDYWYDYTNAFYQSADNTFKIINELRQEEAFYVNVTPKLLDSMGESRDREIDLLTQMVYLSNNVTNISEENLENIERRTILNAKRLLNETLNQVVLNKRVTSPLINVDGSVNLEYLNVSEENKNILNENGETKNIVINNEILRKIDKYESRRSQENLLYRTDVSIQNDYSDLETSYETRNELTLKEIEEKQDIEFKAALDEINNQNVQKLAFINEQKKLLQNTIVNNRIDRERVKREGMLGLDNSREAVLEHLGPKVSDDEAARIYDETVYNLMSEETKTILKMVEEYRENPARVIREFNAQGRAPEVFNQEIELVNKENKPENVTERVNESFGPERYITEEKIIPSVMKEIHKREKRTEKENIELVHKKQNEIIDNEEAIEELRKESENLKKNIEITRNEIENTKRVESRTENIVNKTETTVTEENYESYVERGLRHNMDEIADQVFQRLEKRLSSDRKRRGF